MARLIHPDYQKDPPAGIGCRQWQVRGVVCDNAAAKFWSGLLDEVQSDYPFRVAITLRAAISGQLSPADLDAGKALEHDLAALAGKDLRQVYQEILAVLEITGPPPPTTVQLARSGQCDPFLTVMLEQPDAETMPFLLAWLLEWQSLPSGRWNDPLLEGAFAAHDPLRRRVYHVRCRMTCRHLSEDLFLREAALETGIVETETISEPHSEMTHFPSAPRNNSFDNLK